MSVIRSTPKVEKQKTTKLQLERVDWNLCNIFFRDEVLDKMMRKARCYAI